MHFIAPFLHDSNWSLLFACKLHLSLSELAHPSLLQLSYQKPHFLPHEVWLCRVDWRERGNCLDFFMAPESLGCMQMIYTSVNSTCFNFHKQIILHLMRSDQDEWMNDALNVPPLTPELLGCMWVNYTIISAFCLQPVDKNHPLFTSWGLILMCGWTTWWMQCPRLRSCLAAWMWSSL